MPVCFENSLSQSEKERVGLAGSDTPGARSPTSKKTHVEVSLLSSARATAATATAARATVCHMMARPLGELLFKKRAAQKQNYGSWRLGWRFIRYQTSSMANQEVKLNLASLSPSAAHRSGSPEILPSEPWV